MDDLSTRPFAYQQKVADCRVLYLAFGGRHHDHIQREMRSLGHTTFNKRCLYADRDKQGRRIPGWPERFGWKYEGESERRSERARSVAPSRTRSLPASFQAWLRKVSPEFTWDWKYQQYVYKKLKRVTDGLCKRLMIFMPPRHGKSELVTQRYAAWRLKRDPKMRVVVASYNQKLANRFARGIKRILNHDAAADSEELRVESGESQAPLHDKSICPQCIEKARRCPSAPAPKAQDSQLYTLNSPLTFRRVNTESEWETREGGGVRAVGVGAGITGFGADLVIIDDPVKGHAQAESATSRENVWEWFNSDIYTRLEPNGAIILIQTRWHEDDLAGRLLREMKEDEDAEQWEVIDLPALAEADFTTEAQRHRDDQTEVSTGHVADVDPVTISESSSLCLRASVVETNRDPLGRIPGEALCRERFDEAKLARIKKKLGTYAFSALYQQRPVPAEGGFFKRHWFKTVDHAPPRLRWKRGYDLGLSARPDADFTATARVGFDHDGNMYIDRVLRKRCEYPHQKRMIVNFINTERDTEHLIEESANGSAVIQDLRRDRNLLGRKFRGVRVTKSKTARALAWNALAEEGRVHLVRGPWNAEFIAEACSFPLGTHDDQIDAVSLAVEGHGGRGKRLHFF
jgi:predicted phage terminase large subunit-like protein